MIAACEVDLDNAEIIGDDNPTDNKGNIRDCGGPIIVRIWFALTILDVNLVAGLSRRFDARTEMKVQS